MYLDNVEDNMKICILFQASTQQHRIEGFWNLTHKLGTQSVSASAASIWNAHFYFPNFTLPECLSVAVNIDVYIST